jgi:predicted transcriptional regulator YheO
LTEKQQKPPIKVKMKIGDIEFEIESQEDQIQTAVDRILATVTERMKDLRLTERQAPQPRAETCKSIIQKLWEENWFNTPRGLDAVHSELARIGRPRRYQYAQKRPPQ